MQSGWHADPLRRAELRYFDGVEWTAHISNAGVTSLDDQLDRATPAVTLLEQPKAVSERRGRDRRQGGRRLEDHLARTSKPRLNAAQQLMQPLVAIPVVVAVLVSVLFVHSMLDTNASSDVEQAVAAQDESQSTDASDASPESVPDDEGPGPVDEAETDQEEPVTIGGRDIGRQLPMPSFKPAVPAQGAGGGLSAEAAIEAAVDGDFTGFPSLTVSGSTIKASGAALVSLGSATATPRLATLTSRGTSLLMLRDPVANEVVPGFVGIANLIADTSLLVGVDGINADVVVIGEGEWELTINDLAAGPTLESDPPVYSSNAYRVTAGESLEVVGEQLLDTEDWVLVGVLYPDDGGPSRVVFASESESRTLDETFRVSATGTLQFLVLNGFVEVYSNGRE